MNRTSVTESFIQPMCAKILIIEEWNKCLYEWVIESFIQPIWAKTLIINEQNKCLYECRWIFRSTNLIKNIN